MKHLFRPATALVLLAAVLLSACGTTRPVPPQPRELPRVLVPAAVGPTYTRCYQTEPDTYLLQTGRRVFEPRSGRGPVIESNSSWWPTPPAHGRNSR